MLKLPEIPRAQGETCKSSRVTKKSTPKIKKTNVSPTKHTMRELGSMTTATKETKSTRHLNIQKQIEQDCTSETGKTASTYGSSNATYTKESIGSCEAYSKASSGFRGGFSDATMLSCYLKTQTSKFK